MDADRIVADGQDRALNATGNRKQLDDAIREIRSRYDQEARDRSAVVRVRLWFQMRREIRAAVEQIAPSTGCYLKQ